MSVDNSGFVTDDNNNGSAFEPGGINSAFEGGSDSGTSMGLQGALSAFDQIGSAFDKDAKAKSVDLKNAFVLTDLQHISHTLGNEEILSSQGAMGVVSKATLVEGESTVSVLVKRIKKTGLVKDPLHKEKLILFSNESVITCQYANKGRYLANGRFAGYDESGNMFLVMDFYEGTPLDKLIATGRYVNNTGACKIIIRGILEGLCELFDQGVVHRDLKPANVMVRSDNGQPVLLDFGLAFKSGVTDLSGLKQIGTRGYAAPEQSADKSGITKVSFASDIYSLGIVFLEMLSPVGDFDKSSQETFEESIRKAVGNVDKLAGDFKDFILKCIEKNPEDRFHDAREALEEFISIATQSHNEFKKMCIDPYWDDGIFDNEEKGDLLKKAKEKGVSDKEIIRDFESAKNIYTLFREHVDNALRGNGTRQDLMQEAGRKSFNSVTPRQLDRIINEQRKALMNNPDISADEKKKIKTALVVKQSKRTYGLVAALVLVIISLLVNVFGSRDESPIPSDPKARNALLLTASEAGDVQYVSRLLKAGAYIDFQDSSGATSLHYAIKTGAVETVDTLLSHGPNLDLADSVGWTPLFTAAFQGNPSIIELLLAKGASAGVVDKRNRSALALALFNDHSTAAQVLLKKMNHKDLIEQYDVLVSYARTDKARLAIAEAKDKVNQIRKAIEDDDVDRLASALSYRSNGDLNYTDDQGYSWLHVAAKKGSVKSIKYLVSKNLDVNAKDSSGQTPVFMASQCGSLDAVKTLVSLGADIQAEDLAGHSFASLIKSRDIRKFVTDRMYADSLFVRVSMTGDQKEMERYIAEGAHVDAKDGRGNSALAYAVSRKDFGTIQFLISKKARVSDSYEHGNSLMHLAVKTGDVKLVNEMLAANVDYNAKNDQAQTPLMAAAQQGKWNLVNLLLVQKDISVADSDKDFNNMIHYAAKGGNASIINKMMKQVPVNAFNKEHKTPLHLAASSGCLECAQLLEEAGVSLGVKDAFGKKAIDYARNPQVRKFLFDNENKNELIFEAVKKKNYQSVAQLVSFGAKLNVADKKGVPLIHYALTKDMSILALLLEKGADINAVDADDGNTALAISVKRGDLGLVKFLLSKGAVTDGAYEDGNGLMHLAVKSGESKVVSEILAAHVDYNTRNKFGQTPLMIAIKNHKQSIVELLLAQSNLQVTGSDNNANTILHYAAESGNLPVMEAVLSQMDANAVNKEKKTPLHLAAAAGFLDGVRLLGSSGVSFAVRDVFGKKAVDYARKPLVKKYLHDNENKNELIFSAVKSGNRKFLQELISYGADLNAVDPQGERPLHYAVAKDTLLVSMLLDNGADINGIDSLGESALFRVVRLKRRDMLKSFNSRNANTRQVNNKGETILHTAVATKDTSWASWALTQMNVNVKDANNETPLFTAVRNNDLVMATLLMKRGALTKELNARGKTAMQLVDNKTSTFVENVTFRDERFLAAMYKGDLKNAKFYLDLGANINIKDATTQYTAVCEAAKTGEENKLAFLNSREADLNIECQNLSPLGIAVQHKNANAAKFLIGTKRIDSRAPQTNGVTPLQMAVSFRDAGLVNILANAGGINVPAKNGKTALIMAIETNQPAIVDRLLQAGASQSWRDAQGNAPIHIAARHASGSIAQSLIDRGANVEEENFDGDDPLDIADDCDNQSAYTVIKDVHSWTIWSWIKFIIGLVVVIGILGAVVASRR